MDPTPGRRNSTGLGRDIAILEVLSRCEESGAGVTRIAALLQWEKTQVSRSLSTMAEAGLVERDLETRAYRIGWKVHFLAGRTQENRIATLAVPLLRQLSLRAGLASHLFILRGKFTSSIYSQEQDYRPNPQSWVDRQIPAPVTSPGRILISEWDAESLRLAFPDEVLSTYGGNLKTTTPESLQHELSTIREQGYAIIHQEYDLGVGCSAPVRDLNNTIVAALNIEGPPRLFEGRMDSIIDMTRKTAKLLSQRIGQSRAAGL